MFLPQIVKITDSSKERVSVALEIVIPVRGKSRSFGTTEGSGLGLGQPEAMKALWALQSTSGDIYARLSKAMEQYGEVLCLGWYYYWGTDECA